MNEEQLFQLWVQQNPQYINWFKTLYPQAQTLGGNPLTRDASKADHVLLSKSHHTSDDLVRSAYNNFLYTQDALSRQSDIQNFFNNSGKTDVNEIINDYNTLAETVRKARTSPLTYNSSGYTNSNNAFFQLFPSRSVRGISNNRFNIGYQKNLEDIMGTSSWLRRMDRYKEEYSNASDKDNRTFNIKLGNKTYKIYKEANGNIGVLTDTSQSTPQSTPDFKIPFIPGVDWNKIDKLLTPKSSSVSASGGSVEATPSLDNTIKWEGIRNSLNTWVPNLLAAGRLAGNLWNNSRVYNEELKGLRPILQQTYNTHRLIVGDEATKLAYYRRAALGQTRAAQPFTSDATLLQAAQMEAKAKADELRALGDLADNLMIQKTSDESNQHQLANVLRATQVANQNMAAINQTNAARHNLLALKQSANWTSVDNFLQGIEYRSRQRNAEERALETELWKLLMEQEMLNDPEYISLKKQLRDAWYKSSDPTTDAEVSRLQTLLRAKQIEIKRRAFQTKPRQFKKGSKITFKDDLLYKSTKDAVEHFRKMSKLSSDALNRKRIKVEALISHPKKMLQGGVAPFTVYKPVALGGEQSFSVESTKSPVKSSAKETSDVISDLFKSLLGKGLPSDVMLVLRNMQNFFAQQLMFGDGLDSEDLQSLYLQQWNLISRVQFEKEQYDEAKKVASENDALNEVAVNSFGQYIILNRETNKIEEVSLKEFNIKKHRPLTNNLLLNLRAYSTNLTNPEGTEFLNTVSNGIGMKKVGELIKALLPKIGNVEQTIEGYTKLESHRIIQGVELLKEAPSGTYKYTTYTKNLTPELRGQVAAAINYIKLALPTNSKAVLDMHAKLRGVDSSSLIGLYVSSSVDTAYKMEFDAVTGRAAKDSNGKSSEELKLDAATAMISGKGYKEKIEFNPGTSYAISVNAIHTGFLKKSGENMGSGITMQEATTSTLSKVLDWNNSTLGGSRISPTGYNRIIINEDDVVAVDLPVGSNKNTPDFSMLKNLLQLDKELLKQNIEDNSENWEKVNLICQKLDLPPKYKNDGTLNEYAWNRFAAFLVTTDDSVLLNKDIILEDILKLVDDSDIREQYELLVLKNNKDYRLGSGILGIGKQALYQGTVFVPIKPNYVAGALSGGLNISMSYATELELLELGYNSSKISTYKPAINFNEL